MCYNILQSNGGDKDSGQMIIPVENRTCPSGLEEREDGSFRNLTWLCILYVLAREGNTVRHQQMDWGQDVPGEDLHLLLSRWCMFRSRYSTFQQVQLVAGQQDPSGD